MPHRTLILSGYACTSRIWEPVRAALAPRTQITLVDWPTDLTPTFHCLEDYSGWLSQHYPLEAYDRIIGHSLGGLVAVQALSAAQTWNGKLILVESFLLPPGPFFQNLLMPGADPRIAQPVTAMLNEQRPLYSPALQQALRQVDLTGRVRASAWPIDALYGDRGRPDQAISALNWPTDLCARIPVPLVPNACHFPMLENPTHTAGLLLRMIKADNQPG